jgi:hypothetical protein
MWHCVHVCLARTALGGGGGGGGGGFLHELLLLGVLVSCVCACRATSCFRRSWL